MHFLQLPVWARVLKLSLLNQFGSLTYQVGKWVRHEGMMYESEWEWWMDSELNNLYRCINGRWFKFRQLRQRKKRRGVQDSFKYYVPLRDPPPSNNLVKTSV